MTKLFQTILIVFLSFSIFADDTDLGPQGSAVEIFQCNFSNGKDLEDTLKVASKWDAWADDNYSVPYAGYVMTPFYQTKTDFPFDLFWLGVTPSFKALGIAQDEWASKGTKLAADFERVSPCPNHASIYSFAVRRPENQTPNGYLTIRGCTNKEGTTQADYFAANAKQNEYMDSIGLDSGIYYWFMGAGSGIDQPYDYLEVTAVSSMSEWGKMPDNFLTGNPAPQDLDALRDCDTARVYSIQYVGGKTFD